MKIIAHLLKDNHYTPYQFDRTFSIKQKNPNKRRFTYWKFMNPESISLIER